MNAKSFLSTPLFLALTFSIPAWGQTQMTAPAPPSKLTRPDSIQDSGVYDYWAGMSGQGRAGGVLLGKIAVEGEASLPWQPVPISVLCNGTVINTTQTDPKGRFVIAPTHVKGDLSVQPDEARQMFAHYEGCAVQASLTGFRSNALTITQRNLRENPDLGTITLSRKEDRAVGTAVSSTTQAAPSNARKSYEKARLELLDKKPDRAQQELQKAVQIYPQFAEAWYQLGVLQETSNPQEASNSFAKATAADQQFVLPYGQLAVLATQQQKWQEALDNTNHMLQLDPAGTPQVWFMNALANFQLAKYGPAQESATKSLAIDPQHQMPSTEQLLAVILAQKGDYAGALEHLRNCLTYLPTGASSDLVKQQIAQIEKHAPGTPPK